jgi:hypothetical protein
VAAHTFTSSENFAHLSLRDLLEARDQYHVHLMRRPNVVATAVGRYRIRVNDSWPTEKGLARQISAHTRKLSGACLFMALNPRVRKDNGRAQRIESWRTCAKNPSTFLTAVVCPFA